MASYQILAFAALFLILLPVAVNGDLDDLSPALSPFYDRLCDDVDCGKGTCKADISYPLNYICECDAGWKRTQDDSDDDDDHKFLPCVIPNCTLDYSCQPAPPPVPQREVPRNSSLFDPCYWAYCGEGNCNKTATYKYPRIRLLPPRDYGRKSRSYTRWWSRESQHIPSREASLGGYWDDVHVYSSMVVACKTRDLPSLSTLGICRLGPRSSLDSCELDPRARLEHVSKTSVEAKIVPCTTKYKEMRRSLRVWGIEIPHFAYEFSIPEGEQSLSDTSDGGFLLPLHILEARVKCKVADKFDYPTEWSMSSQDMCLFKRTIETNYGKAQLERLRTGNPSIIKDLITVRNVFLYYVEGYNPNSINSDELGRVLTGLQKGPANYFYNYWEIKPHPWMLASSWVERVAPINLLTAPTNVRIVGGADTAQALGSDSEETLNTFLEMEDALGL
ncbi:hypothetical protein Gogos_000814 [Gossypium gossypioides]|uniref:EGF-like domain-containing protein n=1 Tax=Gossypium gossypioides TaxID=34282 RepID=A0A7J9CU14_GOSGO|nr:hypothetical protein [Gossypium gossypioides]